MRFLGTIDSKTDAKGRVFLPASFRKVLSTAGAERLVLRKDIFQPCLVLYPESVWNQMLDSLRARLNRWNRQDQMVFRQFVSDVEPVALDGALASLACFYGLTKRETEILGLYARGRDINFVCQALDLSRNTVKAHVKHIYAKLDIHSHQELIDLVEGKGE